MGPACNLYFIGRCTAWVHGIHPARLGFFEDRLYGLVEELGKAGVGGHPNEEIEEAEIIEDARAGFWKGCDEQDEVQEREDFVEKSPSDKDVFAAPAPCELGRAVGRRGASKWRQAGRFFKDLEDYSIERKSAVSQEFWRKMEKLEFEQKMNPKNRPHFSFKTLSRDW